MRVPINLDELTAIRPKGKVLKKKAHAAVMAARPRATSIIPLIRSKVNTGPERFFDWVGLVFSDTILGTFTSIDTLSNRDAYYLVTEGSRQLLARVGREAVESQEPLQPVTTRAFIIGMNRFKKELNPII